MRQRINTYHIRAIFTRFWFKAYTTNFYKCLREFFFWREEADRKETRDGHLKSSESQSQGSLWSLVNFIYLQQLSKYFIDIDSVSGMRFFLIQDVTYRRIFTNKSLKESLKRLLPWRAQVINIRGLLYCSGWIRARLWHRLFCVV